MTEVVVPTGKFAMLVLSNGLRYFGIAMETNAILW
jgi:hypothetical protein